MTNKCFFFFSIVIGLLLSGCLGNIEEEVLKEPVEYVNPFIGASTSKGKAGIYHGLGKTFPGATTPYGMVQISPNTIIGGDDGPCYSYEHTNIEGFAFTQMSGVGEYGDLDNFLVMPTTGPLQTNAGEDEEPGKGYLSRYSKEAEVAKAGYYGVTLSDYDIRVEMTAAAQSGIMRFTFPENDTSRIKIDLARRVGGTSTMQYVEVVDDSTIQGWMKCTPEGGGWGNGEGNPNCTVHYYAQYDKSLENVGIWSADIPNDWSRKRQAVTSKKYQDLIARSKVYKATTERKGEHLGFLPSSKQRLKSKFS